MIPGSHTNQNGQQEKRACPPVPFIKQAASQKEAQNENGQQKKKAKKTSIHHSLFFPL